MKRTVLCFMLAFFAIALVSAQGNDRWGQGRGQGPRGHDMRGHGFQQGKGFSKGGQRHHQRQQHSWNRGQQRGFSQSAEKASVSGNLTIVQGMIAVTENDTTYLVRGLNRYIGFIDGLKEGAKVTLEGYAMSRPQDEKTKFMRVQKMNLNGKDYDLAPQPRQPKADGERNRPGPDNQRQQRGQRGR